MLFKVGLALLQQRSSGISYSVTQRQREIGIRMALGAERRSVMLMKVREGARLVFIGITAGLAAGFFVSRLVAAFLFEVTPSDPATFASVSILLGAVALAAYRRRLTPSGSTVIILSGANIDPLLLGQILAG